MVVPTTMLLLLQLDGPSIPDNQLGVLFFFCVFLAQIPLVSGKIPFIDNFEASAVSALQIVLET
jgi:hypothetical protein